MKIKTGVWGIIETGRLGKGVTQANYAAMLGISVPYYNYVVQRKCPLSPEALVRFVTAFPELKAELLAEYEMQRMTAMAREIADVSATLETL